MKYHIDTIPVWDAVKEMCGCPMCRLKCRIEENDVVRYLGGSVMEPSTRIQVNARGFCPRHQMLLYAQKNRLGHALMMHSHLQETRKEVKSVFERAEKGKTSGGGLFSRSRGEMKDAVASAAKSLKAMASSCILCDSIRENLDRYAYTLIHLYQTDSAFKRAFIDNGGVCLSCAGDLLALAAEEMKGEVLSDFVRDLDTTLSARMEQEDHDLKNFTLIFDYRNAGKALDGTKGALERTVNTLRGACLEEPK
ncbi:MAG: hypothetical protein IKP22_13505 [Clostridia bacterium]|nr:hypothetical protein [Clostridia bacterium]